MQRYSIKRLTEICRYYAEKSVAHIVNIKSKPLKKNDVQINYVDYCYFYYVNFIINKGV